MQKIRRSDLVLPELSHQIIGTCFDVYNGLGAGHKEKIYQKAIEIEFTKRHVNYRSQVRSTLMYKDVKVGLYVYDFIVDNKVVVELKIGGRFRKQNFEQVQNYLTQSKLQLGLLIRFNDDGVTFSRVLPALLVDS